MLHNLILRDSDAVADGELEGEATDTDSSDGDAGDEAEVGVEADGPGAVAGGAPPAGHGYEIVFGTQECRDAGAALRASLVNFLWAARAAGQQM